MKYLYMLTIVIASCGKNEPGTPGTNKVPVKPINSVNTVIIAASRNETGQSQPGAVFMSQKVAVKVPSPQDIMLIANATEFYHATLYVGPTIACDYVHNAGQSGYAMGAGCNTPNTEVLVSPNEAVILQIENNGQTQTSSAQMPITYTVLE